MRVHRSVQADDAEKRQITRRLLLAGMALFLTITLWVGTMTYSVVRQAIVLLIPTATEIATSLPTAVPDLQQISMDILGPEKESALQNQIIDTFKSQYPTEPASGYSFYRIGKSGYYLDVVSVNDPSRGINGPFMIYFVDNKGNLLSTTFKDSDSALKFSSPGLSVGWTGKTGDSVGISAGGRVFYFDSSTNFGKMLEQALSNQSLVVNANK